MSNINAQIGCGIRGRKIDRRPTRYVWEFCSAERFEHYWLPKFESGAMKPEDAPLAPFMQIHEEADHDEIPA